MFACCSKPLEEVDQGCGQLRFDAIAPNLRKSAGDVAGLEASRLYETLKRVYEDCKLDEGDVWDWKSKL